jgi:hypothetical protein
MHGSSVSEIQPRNMCWFPCFSFFWEKYRELYYLDMLRNLRKYGTEEEMECIIPIEKNLLDIKWTFGDSNVDSEPITVQPTRNEADNARIEVLREAEPARSETSLPLFRSHLGTIQFSYGGGGEFFQT